MTLIEKGRIEYTERAFEQDAAAAMKGRIERALVELITNSDDSYANLEEEGVRVNGLIRIEVERRRKDRPWTVIVRDCAEGMNVNDMRNKICRAGGQTSGFEKGRAVRGLLGRGAKDVAAFGKVTFEAIKNNICNACNLDKRGNYTIKESLPATRTIRQKLQFESGCGTVATIEVGSQFRAPQHATLLNHLCHHYALRDIASDPNRKMLLVDLNERDNEGDHVVYKLPPGKPVLEDDFLVPGYPTAKARILIFRSPLRLMEGQNSPYGQGGILVKSRRAIHQKALFGFEGDPYAQWFFGRLECPFIDDLIREYEDGFGKGSIFKPLNPTRIVERQRDGLVEEHHFTKALFGEAKKRLAELVEQEKKKDQERKREIQSEETTKSLRRLAAAASKFIAEKMQELEIENVVGPGVPRMKADLAIVPSAALIKPGEEKTFSVFAKYELVEKAGTKVLLTKEGEGIELLGKKELWLIPRKDRPEISSATFKVRGVTPGKMALVKARLGDATADTGIEVQEKEKPTVIPEGISFEHNSYNVRLGKTKKLSLRAKIPGQDLEGVMVKVSTDTKAIVPLRPLIPLGWDRTLGCFTAEAEIAGNEGAKGKISAHWEKFDAEARVTVVKHELTGPFSFEPKIVDEDFGPQRAIWDRPNGLLKISAKHKSVGRYLGPAEERFPGQEKPHFKTLLAEIVADQVARYIIETREEKQGKDEDLDAPAFYLMHPKYMGEFLPIAHEMQLPSLELRKLQ